MLQNIFLKTANQSFFLTELSFNYLKPLFEGVITKNKSKRTGKFKIDVPLQPNVKKKDGTEEYNPIQSYRNHFPHTPST